MLNESKYQTMIRKSKLYPSIRERVPWLKAPLALVQLKTTFESLAESSYFNCN